MNGHLSPSSRNSGIILFNCIDANVSGQFVLYPHRIWTLFMFRLLSLHTLQFRNCLTCVLDIMRSSPSFRSIFYWGLGKEEVLILWNSASALHGGWQCHRFESVAPSVTFLYSPKQKSHGALREMYINMDLNIRGP